VVNAGSVLEDEDQCGLAHFLEHMAFNGTAHFPRHALIDYLLRPRVAAAIVQTTRTATCNGAARAMLPEDLRTDPVLFPAAGILARGEWFAPQSAASQRLRDRLWTEIKT